MFHWVVPHGGWRFRQGEIALSADTFPKLVSTVRTHRISNGIPEGDVEDDIRSQLIENAFNFKEDKSIA